MVPKIKLDIVRVSGFQFNGVKQTWFFYGPSFPAFPVPCFCSLSLLSVIPLPFSLGSPGQETAGITWPSCSQLPTSFKRLAVASLQCQVVLHVLVCALSRATPLFPLFSVSFLLLWLLWFFLTPGVSSAFCFAFCIFPEDILSPALAAVSSRWSFQSFLFAFLQLC